jgi:hypothetical protein
MIDLESIYQVRYLQQNGTIVTKEEYESKKLQGEQMYIAAFVGCTYHCG